MVAGNLSFDSNRAASSTTATPLASSLAPGASWVASAESLIRLSICPWTMTTRVGSLVPRWTATTSSTRTPSGARGPVKRSPMVSTPRHPPQSAPIERNRRAAHVRAAPMPRTGSVADDRVWRVPKPTSVAIVVRIAAGSGAAATSSSAPAIRPARLICARYRSRRGSPDPCPSARGAGSAGPRSTSRRRCGNGRSGGSAG